MAGYKVTLAKPSIDARDEKRVVAALRSGQLSLGREQDEFEKRLSSLVGTAHAAATSSGTGGLHLAIRSLGITAGDEVITTPFSFVASTNCFLYEGASPVFVDIENDTLNLDVSKIEDAITDRTKAILPVHIFGQMADMKAIRRIARRHSLRIIEDACEALGAERDGVRPGEYSDAAVFGFYPNKQITTGEGGAVATNRSSLHKSIVALRNQGRSGSDWLSHRMLGYNYRLDELSAALGNAQMEKFEEMQDARARVAGWYADALQDVPGLVLPRPVPHSRHAWFVYVVRVPKNKRPAVLDALEKAGIQAKPYLSLLHLQPFMVERFGYKPGAFPVAEQVMEETIALPFYPALPQSDVDTIAQVIRKELS